MKFNHVGNIGFVYYIDHIGADGTLKSRERMENIIPNVGRDYILTAAMLSGSQYPTFYIGLHETDYDVVAGDTMTTLMTAVTEATDYASATRMELTPDALSSGLFSNTGTPSVFVFTGASVVRGGFITSNSVKSNDTGLLLSGVLFSSPKTMSAGDSLRVTGGLSLTVI